MIEFLVTICIKIKSDLDDLVNTLQKNYQDDDQNSFAKFGHSKLF